MSENEYSDYYAEDLDRRVNRQMADIFADSDDSRSVHSSHEHFRQ